MCHGVPSYLKRQHSMHRSFNLYLHICTCVYIYILQCIEQCISCPSIVYFILSIKSKIMRFTAILLNQFRQLFSESTRTREISSTINNLNLLPTILDQILVFNQISASNTETNHFLTHCRMINAFTLLVEWIKV